MIVAISSSKSLGIFGGGTAFGPVRSRDADDGRGAFLPDDRRGTLRSWKPVIRPMASLMRCSPDTMPAKHGPSTPTTL
jgi:hypothetical protein